MHSMKKIRVLIVVPVLMVMLCSCSTVGLTKKRSRVSPSVEFLVCARQEYIDAVYGDCTREIVKDWLTHNAPLDVLVPN